MTDPLALTATAFSALVAVTILAVTGLKGWRDWIALQQMLPGRARHDEAPGSAGARIELADLKERVRKLEAIAAGVDLSRGRSSHPRRTSAIPAARTIGLHDTMVRAMEQGRIGAVLEL